MNRSPCSTHKRLGIEWYKGALLCNAIDFSYAEVLVIHADLLPLLDTSRTGLLRDIIVVGIVAGGELPADSQLRYHPASVLEPSEVVTTPPVVEPWDTNYIIFTSGTTGPSKAVLCSYVQTWVGGPMGMDYFKADDRLLANLPLFHVSGTGLHRRRDYPSMSLSCSVSWNHAWPISCCRAISA